MTPALLLAPAPPSSDWKIEKEKQPLKWYQTAQKMRYVSRVILAASITLGATAVTCTFQLKSGALPLTTSGVFLSLAGFAIGTKLLNKRYLKDPAYRLEIQKEMRQILTHNGYSALKMIYGKKLVFEIFSKNSISELVLQEIKQRKDYKTLQNNFNIHELIEDKILPSEMLVNLFLFEIQNLSFIEVINKYGLEPILDHKILNDKPEYKEELLKELREKGFKTFILTHDWVFFESKILETNDKVVQSEFRKYLSNTSSSEIDHQTCLRLGFISSIQEIYTSNI